METHGPAWATHVCVAPSHCWPAGQGKAGTSHPGTHPRVRSQRLPGGQFAGVQVEMQVFVVESQRPLFGQVPPLPQFSLQTPSALSQVWPAGQAPVVQSGRVATHWDTLGLQTDPAGQADVAEHPVWQDSEIGSQYWPATHPVIEQSGGAGLQSPDAQISP